MKLAHIALWTTDLAASALFWEKYFQAEIGEKYISQNRQGFASIFVKLPNSEIRIELMEGPWVTPNPGEACGWAHVAYSVGSTGKVDEIAKQFEQDDLLVSAPRRTGDGYYEAVVRSPDGILIEIVE